MVATSGPAAVGQELVAYLFAVTDGPDAEKARGAVDRIRRRADDVLRLQFPIEAGGQPPDGLLVARQSPDTACQLLLRRDADLLTMSLLVTEPGPQDGSSGWSALDALLDEVVGADAGALLGAVRLYLAKTGDQAADPAVGVRGRTARELPAARQEAAWWDQGPAVTGRLRAWDLRPHAIGRSDRGILVLAPPGGDRELSLWAWSDGGHHLAPFARYLKHAAKVDYELRVHHAAAPVTELCRQLEDGILARQAGGPDATEPQLSELGRRAAARIALVKSMDRTVEIAVANARAALETEMPAHGGLLDEDAATWLWFRQRLGDDVAYLENLYEAVRCLDDTGAPAAAPALQVRERGGGPVIGLVTAMPEEFAAAKAMLDGAVRRNVEHDRSNYLVGTMPSADPGDAHRVVLTMLGDTGNDAAAAACTELARSFASVGVLMMVGIAAGVPDPRRPERHVRLGDIVVSTWGIVDYDHVVDRPGERAPRQPVPRPSRLLAQQANWLAAEEMAGRRPWEERLDEVIAAGMTEFGRPPDATDLLYLGDGARRPIAHPDPAASGHRPGRPKVHYGHIGSGDRALRNAASRDELAVRYNLRALEMEGKGVGDAGFASGLEWLVVRGISDYGDTRTDARWRKYASLTAAAYTWALLSVCPPFEPRGGHTRAVDG